MTGQGRASKERSVGERRFKKVSFGRKKGGRQGRERVRRRGT